MACLDANGNAIPLIAEHGHGAVQLIAETGDGSVMYGGVESYIEPCEVTLNEGGEAVKVSSEDLILGGVDAAAAQNTETYFVRHVSNGVAASAVEDTLPKEEAGEDQEVLLK
ncbi:PREDICTED: uncharacterized protein LOC106819990 [Priapulus caudatus]|uniref:Uncharacterized protein LOC106819990 n=1 Tax=Priapulus caudatus TaxID=37621 RepID=A0ABM1F6G9_PRICU|nr:PREDICTED: uncharacterized protein LOC106819990 [Priapulus caudatus]